MHFRGIVYTLATIRRLMVRFLFDLLRTHDPMKKSIGSIGSWIELSNVGSCIFSSDLELLRTETPLSVPTVGPRTALLNTEQKFRRKIDSEEPKLSYL